MTVAEAAPEQDGGYARGCLLVVFAGVAMSLGGPLVRLLEQASEWQFLFYRALALLSTLLLLLAFRNRGDLLTPFRVGGLNAVVGGFCLSLAFVGFVFSLTHTTVANALFMLSASPFIAAILGWLVLRESVRRATWLAMLCAGLGIGIMVAEGIAQNDLFGDLAGLGAAVGFAAFSVAIRRGKHLDMVPAVCLAAVFSALMSGALVWLLEQGFAVSPRDLSLCILYGAVAMGVGLALFTAGARHVPAAEITLLSLSEVVLGPVWVWLWLTEVPSLPTLAGGLVLLAAVAGQALSGMRRKRPALPVV